MASRGRDDLVDLNWRDETERRPLFGDDAAVLRVAVALWLALTLWKLWLASIAAVVWEEGHFVVASRFPALAYPDIPAGWPMFTAGVEALAGDGVFAVRAAGLVVAQLIPLGVWFMAKPVVGQRFALFAALASLILPPTTISGPIYYPECALQLMLAVMLGCILRATASTGLDRLGWWVATGVSGGIGLLIHYRFALPGGGVVLYALLTREGRRLWRDPGFWMAGAIAAAFMAPAVAYNLLEDAPAIAYHGAGRHNYRVSPDGALAFLSMQALLCTPVLLVGMAYAAGTGWRREPQARLLIVVGATTVLTYALHATAATRSMPQWPFLGYVPLLALLPGAAARFVDGAEGARARGRRAAVAWSAPMLAAVTLAGLTAILVGYDRADTLSPSLRSRLPARFEDWTAIRPALDRVEAAAAARLGGTPVLAASGHVTALRLEFPGDGRIAYTLDEPNDELTRFDQMRADMGRDAAALARDAAGRPAAIVLAQPTYLYHTREETAFRVDLCRRFDDVRSEGVYAAGVGKSSAELFSGRVRASPGPTASCAFLPPVYVARPQRGERLTPGDDQNFFGMAASSGGVVRVSVAVDGRTAVEARTALDPAGARAPEALRFDPAWPGVQFDFKLPAEVLTPGAHRLTTTGFSASGERVGSDERVVYVDP